MSKKEETAWEAKREDQWENRADILTEQVTKRNNREDLPGDPAHTAQAAGEGYL
jgi:hypothetical protein